jgi:DNA-binding MarR family transcriptional regulator
MNVKKKPIPDELIPYRNVPSLPPELAFAPGYLARRLHQAFLAAWECNVDANLTGAQFAVLNAIYRYPGQDQGSMAAVAALDRSTMADVVYRLQKRGFVVPQADPLDGRRKLLYLSKTGATMFEETNRKVRALDEVLLSGRTPQEKEELLSTLIEVAERWEALAPKF